MSQVAPPGQGVGETTEKAARVSLPLARRKARPLRARRYGKRRVRLTPADASREATGTQARPPITGVANGPSVVGVPERPSPLTPAMRVRQAEGVGAETGPPSMVVPPTPRLTTARVAEPLLVAPKRPSVPSLTKPIRPKPLTQATPHLDQSLFRLEKSHLFPGRKAMKLPMTTRTGSRDETARERKDGRAVLEPKAARERVHPPGP